MYGQLGLIEDSQNVYELLDKTAKGTWQETIHTLESQYDAINGAFRMASVRVQTFHSIRFGSKALVMSSL